MGIDTNETEVRGPAGSVDWHSPVWHHQDGSDADW